MGGCIVLADAFLVKCPKCEQTYVDGDLHLCRPKTTPAVTVTLDCPYCGKAVTMFVHSGMEYKNGDTFGLCPNCRKPVIVRFVSE